MTKQDVKLLDELYLRTEHLPDILYVRAAEPGYKITDDDKKLVLDTYSKLDDILKEVAAFINIKFPGCERHVRAWNEIDFDTKIGPFKIVTNDREHIKREWTKGLFDLKSLIKVLRNETVLLMENEKNEDEKTGTKTQTQHLTISINNNALVSHDRVNEKKSWIEIASWIAGIIAALMGLYSILK